MVTPLVRFPTHALARVVLGALFAALFVGGPTPAVAIAPDNDNYLRSKTVQDARKRVPARAAFFVDTTDATVQSDLFNPDPDGLFLTGGGREDTTCDGTVFGRTVWYDLHPHVSGAIDISATGFDSVVTIYRWNRLTSRIVRKVYCENDDRGPLERVIAPEHLRRGDAYTVQIGGVGGIGGPLNVSFAFFPDRDRDGIFDVRDGCRAMPGIAAAGGCPPRLNARVAYTFARMGGGISFTSLRVPRVPAGGRVLARCRRCGIRQLVTVGRRARSVKLSRFLDRVMPPGSRLEVFVTHRRTRTGRFRHGAIGEYARYRLGRSRVGEPVVRCLRPGSLKPRRRCTR